MTEDLFENAIRLLKLAEKAGAEEAEVFGSAAKVVDVDLRKDQVEMASESRDRGLGLRAVVGGRSASRPPATSLSWSWWLRAP